MKRTFDKNILLDVVKTLFVGLLVVICTFPYNKWTYSFGIDPTLTWAFNFLFENGLGLGKNIIFPHGPLAFFMYPLPDNILISTFVNTILKILLVFNLAKLLSYQKEQTKWILTLISAYFISIVSGFNHIILANLILLYCNSYSVENRNFKYIAFIITAFAFYVKAYLAIISIVIFLSYTGYILFTDKKIKTFLLDGLTLLMLIVFFWIVMYGSISGFLKYVWGMFQLAQDNSTAAAYYPQNNWVVLSLFILMFPLLMVLNRKRKFIFYSVLIGLSLFAAWKHGMAREDYYHVRGFYIYFILCSIILLLFYKKNTYTNLLIIGVAVILFSINFKNSVNYKTSEYELFGVNNFFQFITEFDELRRKSERISDEEISINKLPQNVVDSIGDSTVDVYPWDYSIVAANKFHWKPRVVINSYASYTSWLDKQNSNHFNSEDAPQFLIWEFKKPSSDVNGSDFNSIDDRYLLNDEPQTILQILKNYEHWYSNSRFLILKQRKEALNVLTKDTSSEEFTWDEWINVPEGLEGQLIRAKLTFKKSIIQRLKSFFYKDEQFWIYLKLDNGQIYKNRIVPKNAADGLWINPYIFNAKNLMAVKNIMFKASNETILKKQIEVSWEGYNFNKPDVITDFFNIQISNTDSTLLISEQGFEKSHQKYWNTLSDEFVATDAFEGTKSFLLKPGMFSLTYSYPLDSLPPMDTRITADCWVKAKDYNYSNKISFVLSIDDNKGKSIWKGKSVDMQLIDKNRWNNIFNFVEYSNKDTNCILKAYLWNISNQEILVDDFRVRIATN